MSTGPPTLPFYPLNDPSKKVIGYHKSLGHTEYPCLLGLLSIFRGLVFYYWDLFLDLPVTDPVTVGPQTVLDR